MLGTFLSGDPSQMFRNAVKITLVTTAGLIGTWVINGVLAAVQERASFPMLNAQIERVREDMEHIPCSGEVVAFQGLVSKAVEWNIRIAHEQQANGIWYADYFSTDRWNDVEPVSLPCRPELTEVR